MNPEQQGGQLPAPTPDQNQTQAPSPIPAAAPGGNPYEFIINPQKPQRKVAIAGNSTMQRVFIVVGGLAVLIILAVVISSVLSSGSKEKTQGLLTTAQDQAEIARIAGDASLHATTLPVQNLAQNVQASITSDNTALVQYMAKNGQKVSPQMLAAKRSKTVDASLASAQENNTYDSTFKDILQTELTQYLRALTTAYKTNPGVKGKALLNQQYDAAKLLLAQSQAN